MSAVSIVERFVEEASIGVGAQNVAPADIDKDGDLDLFVSSDAGGSDAQLVWFENLDGNGAAWRQATIGEPIRSDSFGLGLATGDLDNDGDLDLVATSNLSPAHIFWYENISGNGRFGPRRELLETPFSFDVDPTVTDLDGDGDIDILSGSSWLENVNRGDRFELRRLLAADVRTEVVDIDGDSDWDLIALEPTNSKANLYLNDRGWAQFSDAIPIALSDTRASTVSSGDLDADGDIDLVFAGAQLNWVENLGDNSFGDSQFIATSERTNRQFSVDPADVDQDGDLDLVAASSGDGKIVWYENTGQGSFTKEHTVESFVPSAYKIGVADFNGDGKQDVVFASLGDLRWYPNAGDGAIADPVIMTTSLAGITSPSSGDMDGDGDSDVILGARIDGAIVWYENLGSGWGQRSVGSVPGEAILHTVTSDLDGDGDLDIIGSFSDGLRWYENADSAGDNFVAHDVGVGQTIMASPGDIDGDGDNDIVAWIAGAISWFENVDGRGTFGARQPLLSSPNKGDSSVHARDFDGDGRDDILAFSGFNDLAVWLKNEDRGLRFEVRKLDIRTGREDTPSVVDIDLDGDLDILIDGSILLNDGQGSFDEWNAVSGATRIVGAGDVDQDGDLDLITRTNTSLRWRENIGGRFEDRQALVPDLGFNGSAYLAHIDPNDGINVLVATERSELYWIDFAVPGDVNGDDVFDSADLVAALAAGEYDDDLVGNSSFETGDWNGDGEFDSSDLVLAFQAGYAGGQL